MEGGVVAMPLTGVSKQLHNRFWARSRLKPSPCTGAPAALADVVTQILTQKLQQRPGVAFCRPCQEVALAMLL